MNKNIKYFALVLAFILTVLSWPMSASYSEAGRVASGSIYKIKNSGSGKYLSASPDETNIIESFDGSDCAQLFRILNGESEGAYRINPVCENNGNYKCLDVDAGSIDGEPALARWCNVRIYVPTDDAAQLFEFASAGTDKNGKSLYALRLKSNPELVITSSRCASIDNVYVDKYTESDFQKWELEEYTSLQESYYASMNLAYPFRGSNIPTEINSQYGDYGRYQEYRSYEKVHCGIAIPADSESKIYSAFEGTVVLIDTNLISGNYIVIEAKNLKVYGSDVKLRLIYSNLLESARNFVKEGQSVTADTVVGRVGKGDSPEYYHLQFEILTNGECSAKLNETINPLTFYPNMKFTYFYDIT